MRRPKPQQVIITIGVLAALGTIFSGIAPRVTKWEEDSEVSRHVFVNIPDPLYWLFYATAAAMLLVCAWLVSQRVRNYSRGAADDRRTTKANAHRRMKDFRAGVWMRTLLRDPVAGVMHSFIYFGFLVLLAATIILEIDHQLPESLKFLHGKVYMGYSAIADLFGLIFLIGILWAIARRYIQRPYRIRIKTQPEDAVVLGTFLVIAVTGFLIEGFRIALRRPAVVREVVVRRLRALEPGSTASSTADLENWHRVLWGTHFAAFVAFLVLLPTTKLRHMVTSPMNMYLKDKDRPKGAMKPMPNLMETELETFGASTIEDFTWKQLFDTDACTVCGRCTSVCPAHATGKPLDPREIVLKVGEVMAATGDPRGVAAGGRRQGHHHRRRLGVRADHLRGAVGRAPPARRATRSARSTSRSSTRSSTCAATSPSWRATSPSSSATRTARWRTRPTSTA